MDINYIILAHTAPKQLARLIARLIEKDVYFYVHVDKDVDIKPFEIEIKIFSGIFFLAENKRVAAIWADFSLVQATLNAIEQIILDQRNGYCVLMSAQDYPIKDRAFIRAFFEKNYGKNFIGGQPLNMQYFTAEWLRRINLYQVALSKKRNDVLMFPSVYEKCFYTKINFQSLYLLIRRKSFFAFLKLLPALFKKRTFLPYLNPYCGSQWWALPIETIYLIKDFINKHPDYIDYHKYTFAADEICFQSIVHSIVNKRKIGEELVFVDWSGNEFSPVTFMENDFERLANQDSSKLFARKFDLQADSKVLDMLDSLSCAS